MSGQARLHEGAELDVSSQFSNARLSGSTYPHLQQVTFFLPEYPSGSCDVLHGLGKEDQRLVEGFARYARTVSVVLRMKIRKWGI